MAYYCRLFALQEALALRSAGKTTSADMGFIMGLMDEAEAEKKTLGAQLDDSSDAMHVENFGQELFQKADDQDRAGQSTLQVAKVYNAAYVVMETCKQFGELPSDLAEKIKYAKARAVEIGLAIKQNRPPAPPPRTEDEGGGGGGGGGSGGGGDALPPTYADPPGGYAPPPAPPPEAPAELPSYMGLPPAPPPGYDEAPPAPIAPTHQTSLGSALPAAPPPSSAMAPPAYAALPPSPGYKPGRAQIMEAMKLCSTAESSLRFQDSDSAVKVLHHALQLLTVPPKGRP